MSRSIHIASAVILLCCPAYLVAQEDAVPLGDVAREARKSKPAEEQKVIDNDNFAIMMDKAESARLDGKPVFSIDRSGKSFRITSPDGTCSLSFNANATALISAPYVASDLPQDELPKIAGSAAIHDDAIEVALHNGTGWELREIVVGITVLQAPATPEYQPAKLTFGPEPLPTEKLPDLTVLYHLKGAGAPDSTTVFRGAMGGNFADTSQSSLGQNGFGSNKDWHWAIVAARGVPPANPNRAPGEQVPVANSVSAPANSPPPIRPIPNSSDSTTAGSPLSSSPGQ
jgi:hypothetical protein